MKKFIKYIGSKSLNGNSIAKFEDGNSVILEHEREGVVLATKKFRKNDYDELDIPDGVDTLAFMLDTFFDCTMLGKDYCTQNEGDCESCSLVNYGKVCRNNQI
jgi:hypothetical protein